MRIIEEMTPEKLAEAIRGANEEWLAKHVAEDKALKREEERNLRKYIGKLKWPRAKIRTTCACGKTIQLSHIMTRDGAEIYQDFCPNCYSLWELHGTTVSQGWNKHLRRELVPPLMRPIVWPTRHTRRHDAERPRKR